VSSDILERWLGEVITAPGATGLGSVDEARRVLLEDALRVADLVERLPGRVVDVGSGGGSPGLPLAATLPHRAFTLLEAERRKCEFLERFAAELPNVDVVWGRAEDQALDAYGVALGKALAKPPVAVELCLPLVERGGAVLLWLGPTADRDAVSRAAELLGGRLEGDEDGIVVVRKVQATPAGFPRRTGVAKKRPLA
jgi:16S rRNA (guanine527-N7)-methyltransferase